MGFGTGFLLLVVVGFLVLGPKRMQDVLRQAARAKTELDRSTREVRSQLMAEIEAKNSTPN